MAEVDVEQAYQRYFPIVREKCARMLRDSAEAQDVAQETFTRLWTQRTRFDNPAGVASWIYLTSTRLAVDRYRQRARAGEVAFPQDELVGPAGDMPDRRVQTRQALARLVGCVPGRELEAVVLSRIDGLNHQDIAQVMGTSDRTVRRLLARFQRRLAALVEDAS